MRAHNFSAGPGTLPLSVLEEARDEMLEFADARASVMEISHRSPQYTAVADSARQLLKSLLGLGDDWHILFLQGGASTQFYQVPLNFLPNGSTADYVNTGEWSKKAILEAERIGTVRIAASSASSNFTHLPQSDSWDLTSGASYVHFTSNNTIHGTGYADDPRAESPLVCDASSDFLARPMELDGYGLIYAGAQKNLGPAGVTVVLIRESLLSTRRPDLPAILDYRTHAAKLFNTPPVFAVYMVEKVLRWIDSLGGLARMQERNQAKAATLYGRIDSSEFFRGTADAGSRSLMNVTFRLPTEVLEAEFVSEAKSHGLVGLKGHRSAGGIRASIYNACEPSSVDTLVAFMDNFEAMKG